MPAQCNWCRLCGFPHPSKQRDPGGQRGKALPSSFPAHPQGGGETPPPLDKGWPPQDGYRGHRPHQLVGWLGGKAPPGDPRPDGLWPGHCQPGLPHLQAGTGENAAMMPGSVGQGAGKAPGGSCALLLTHWALGRVHWPWGEEGLRAARAWQLGYVPDLHRPRTAQ